MPAIGNLDSVGQRTGRRLAISAASVPCDDGDRRTVLQPILCSRLLTVFQQHDGTSPLQIADDRAVAMIASPSEVIDAYGHKLVSGFSRTPADHPKKRIVADWQHEAMGHARCRPAAQRQAEVMHDLLEAACSPRPRRQHFVTKPLGEDTTATQHAVTTNLRTVTASSTRRPAIGRSDARRRYRLCTRRETAPQHGQRACA